MSKRQFSVSGMSCGGCESAVENALERLDGVSQVEASHEADTVEIQADDDVSDGDIQDAIESAGYEVAA